MLGRRNTYREDHPFSYFFEYGWILELYLLSTGRLTVKQCIDHKKNALKLYTLLKVQLFMTRNMQERLQGIRSDTLAYFLSYQFSIYPNVCKSYLKSKNIQHLPFLPFAWTNMSLCKIIVSRQYSVYLSGSIDCRHPKTADSYKSISVLDSSL